MILLLFTATYPYDAGAERTFLAGELKTLKANFDRVILVPGICRGNRLTVPDGIEVDETLALTADSRRWVSLLRAIFTPVFYKDIFKRPAILFHRATWMRLLDFAAGAIATRSWVRNWFRRSGVQARECVFYTYWFDYAAMGIGLTKRDHPELKLVSRAHGYDLYEERHPYNYWPCRRSALGFLDHLFVASDAGRRYLANRYPEYASKCTTALLGVPSSGFSTSRSSDRVFHIISCSMLVPVKRVDLILQAVACAAQHKPNVSFEWHHFGDGDTRSNLQETVEATFPSNARGFFPGFVSQQDLFQFYKTNPVDVFVNASQSEGTPVSIMEAISCGIPVIATAVGGNPEIVSSRNGLLVSPNPSAEEFAAALLEMQANPETTAQKGLESYGTWQAKYNAEVNFREFALSLRKIRET